MRPEPPERHGDRAETGRGDRAIAALAARQHGVVARRQLVAMGLGEGAIRHRLGAGRLHRVFRGSYAVGHPLLTIRGRWMAAVLACGDDALLSHQSAAALWDLLPARGGDVDITVDASGRCVRPGLVAHCARIRPEDRATRDQIPVTNVARTLFDLAEVVDPGVLRRAFEAAERLRLLDLRAFDRVCDRRRGRHGLRPMLALLPSLLPAPETRSELERRFLAFCRDAQLPMPAVNVIVAGYEVDMLWADHGLVVELDGYEFHRTRAAFERDRARDTVLQLAGYRVLRLTARRLDQEAEEVAEAIRSLLSPGSRGNAASRDPRRR